MGPVGLLVRARTDAPTLGQDGSGWPVRSVFEMGQDTPGATALFRPSDIILFP